MQSRATDFFPRFVERLATILEVDHVLIARVKEPGQAETLAVWSVGQLLGNIEYPLSGTPCETVIGYKACIYPSNVQELFPKDLLLQRMGVDSYLGLPLQDATGRSLGLLAVMKDKPMQFEKFEEEVLRIAALQIESEIARNDAEQAAKVSEKRLLTLLDHLPGMAYQRLNDTHWSMKVASNGALSLTGYAPDKLIDQPSFFLNSIIHESDRSYVLDEIKKSICQNSSYTIIYRIVTAKNKLRWVQDAGQVVCDNDQNSIILEGFITDITEQHEAQRVKDVVFKIASTVTTRQGDGYFHQLLKSLTQLLDADVGFIGEFEDADDIIGFGDELFESNARVMNTISVVAEGESLLSRSTPIEGSFFEKILHSKEKVVNSGANVQFLGIDRKVDAWIVRRLDNAEGEPIGIIALLYYQPLETNALATSVLRILSSGAAAELFRRRTHEYIHQLAYVDTVTGLPNRVHFIEKLSLLLSEAEEKDSMLALILLDIRRFKEINDNHGHFVGDQILQSVANRLRYVIEQGEVVARLSGDEFAVLLPFTEARDIKFGIERFCDAISVPMHIENRSFTLTASVGTACYPHDAVDSGELFQDASIALYHAKQQDKAVSIYDPVMTLVLKRQQEMIKRLNEAIENNDLELYYQPQVDLKTGRLTGAEALCRWYDKEWGWVSPSEFIPLAEKRGLILHLGAWVLKEAGHQLTEWLDSGYALPGRLSINISAQQFTDTDLINHIKHLLQGVRPEAIGLELTESDFMRDPEQTVLITQTLRSMGYSFSIDDFGTGYSSLSYLRRFFADTLKIDISFVREILSNHHDRVIVQTIIAMADSLGMSTIAEGVETKKQAQLLSRMGCRQGQGYFYSPPLPASIFLETWERDMSLST